MSKIALLLPGQGAQSLGMGEELRNEHSIVNETILEASEVLGRDLIELISNGPEAELNRADLTQPAILAASVATWRLLHNELSINVDYMAGHSLGEYTALVCSGAMQFADALRLVNLRGELMLQAVPEGTGAMAAVLGLSDEEIEQACEQVSGDLLVSPVNYNSPGQVVIAGHKDAVTNAGDLCKEKGAKMVIPLAVSVPSHCELMKPAADKLKPHLDEIEISTPKCSLVSSVDVALQSESSTIKDALIRQLYSPVRWSETIQWFESDGVSAYIDCGPGKVLAGLNKRINRRSVVHVCSDLAGIKKLTESLSS